MKKNRKYERFPIDGQSRTASADVESMLKKIAGEYRRRKHIQKTQPHTQNEEASNFLQREIYWLGKQLIAGEVDWDRLGVVERKRKKAQTRPKELENTFRALLMACFSDDTISRNKRALWTQQMEYALRHKVPARLLCGFIYQCGPSEIWKKNVVKPNYYEEGFRQG